MNLHAIASQAVAAINPPIAGTWQRSTGAATDANFKRVPSYAAGQGITAQMQPLSYGDMRQIEGLNIAGEKQAMYINGLINSVVRPTQQGGDLITLVNGSVWLTVQVLEDFSMTAGWAKIAVVRQS